MSLPGLDRERERGVGSTLWFLFCSLLASGDVLRRVLAPCFQLADIRGHVEALLLRQKLIGHRLLLLRLVEELYARVGIPSPSRGNLGTLG